MWDKTELFWGILDDIVSCEEVGEKRRTAIQKSRELTDEERREMVAFMEECCEELASSGVYLVLKEMNGGQLVEDDMFRRCLSGILANGRNLFERTVKEPECIKQHDLKELLMSAVIEVF